MSNVIYKNFLGKKSIIDLDLSIKYEFDDSNLENNKLFHKFMFEDLLPDEAFDHPFFIADVSFSIPQFSKMRFSNEELEVINTRGLIIFLADFVVSYVGEKINFDFGNIYRNDFDELNKSKISFNYESDCKDIHAFPLDSINELLVNNNISNVTVYTCDSDLSPLKKIYSRINFKYYDLHTRHWIKNYKIEIPIVKKISTKFSCINLRYSLPRHLLMSYLINYQGQYSWYYQSNFEHLKNNLWFDIENWDSKNLNRVKKGSKILDSTSPLIVDIQVNESKKISGLKSDWFLFPADIKQGRNFAENADNLFFNNSFCHIAVETLYASIGSNVGEKPLRPIKFKMPFILVGRAGCLSLLKKYGFKTFDRYWDESYDLEINHEKRMLKIFKVIDDIDRYSLDDLRKMCSDMTDILDHNFNLLTHLNGKNSFVLKNLYV